MSKPHVRINSDGSQFVHDGLQNLVSGIGTRHDKRSHNQFGFDLGSWNFHQLEAAYQSNWIARQIVNVPVDDAMREGREWQSESAQDIEKEERRVQLFPHYRRARYWARLYGGAVILMMTDQPLNSPLRLESLKKGSLKRLVVLDRWEVQPQMMNYTDPLADDYLLPEWYSVRANSTDWIHSSHLIRVDGEDLPRRLREWNEGWGDSSLRKCLEDLKDVTSIKSGIATMVQEANVDVIQREGLSAELASDQEDTLIKRYALANQMKSLVNQLLLDGSEEYQRKQLVFSGLGEIMDRFMTWISGAADIPATRLFGQAPQGMNATGEGDQNNYYDSVRSDQEAVYRHDLEKLDQVLVRSALGEFPDDADWQWSPLYQESGTELAQQELAQAQSEGMRLEQGTLQRSHVMERMRQNGQYALTEEEIEKQRKEEEAEANGEFDPDPDNYNPTQDPIEGMNGDP